MIFKILIVFFVCTSVLAAPKELEVWFLSAQKKAELYQLLQERPLVFHSKLVELQCQQMGDYCFDPQYGLYKRDDLGAQVDLEKVEKSPGPAIPPAQALERELINCDSKNFFDVFCGKAKKLTPASAKLDLWIDTSSSMREMDFSDKEGNCFRKSMMKRLDESCRFNEKLNVMMFDTSIKQAGSMDVLCNNQGLNDQKRLMDWIERSEARKLVIITDIYEFSTEFAEFIDKKKGKVRGDRNGLVASQLLDLVDELATSCR